MQKIEIDIGLRVLQALKANKPEDVLVAIADFIRSANKTQTAKDLRLSRQTLYHNLKSDKANPTVKTLAKLVHASLLKKSFVK